MDMKKTKSVETIQNKYGKGRLSITVEKYEEEEDYSD